MEFTELVKKYAKAIVAFILAIVVNMVTDLASGARPWPQDRDEWFRYLGSSVVLALGVYGVPNKQDKGQVSKSLDKLPEGETREVVTEGLASLPDQEAKEAVVDAYPTWNVG